MAVTHTTRAMQRGFQVLEVLNHSNGSLVSEVVTATGLPRTTAFRLLESLCGIGYIRRDPADDRYRLTTKVRDLSAGFQESVWVGEIARPAIEELSQKILWPLYVSTLYGTSMMVRSSTSAQSRMPIDTYPEGVLVPLLTSGSGKAFLAFCDDDERTALLNILEKSDQPEHRAARNERSLMRMLKKIRSDGYALDRRAPLRRNPGTTSSLAVPVFLRDHVTASLTLRYIDAAMAPEKIVARYYPLLREAGDRIGVGLSIPLE
jgi:IclR family mhp operon transcriptional activator